MKTLEEKIAVMQAYNDGKKIEGKKNGITSWSENENPLLDWSDCDYPLWNWAYYDYRVKPEEQQPEYIPYENAHEFLQAQKEHGLSVMFKKGTNRLVPFVNCYNLYCYVEEKDGYNKCSARELLEYFTWADGTPCGKLKQ